MAQTTQQSREAAEALLAARAGVVLAAAREYGVDRTDELLAMAGAVKAAITAMAEGWSAKAIKLESATFKGKVGVQNALRTAKGEAVGFALGLDSTEVLQRITGLTAEQLAERAEGGIAPAADPYPADTLITEWTYRAGLSVESLTEHELAGVKLMAENVAAKRLSRPEAARRLTTENPTDSLSRIAAAIVPTEPTIGAYLSGASDVIPVGGIIRGRIGPEESGRPAPDLAGALRESLAAQAAGRALRTTPGIEGDGAVVERLDIYGGKPPTPPAASLTTPTMTLFAVAGPPERLTWDQIAAAAERLRTRGHVSPSTIAELAECGLAWLINHAHLNTAEVPCWWNVGGNAFHAAVEEIEGRVHAGQTIDPDYLAPLWHTHFIAEIAKTRYEAKGEVDPSLWRAGGRGLENGPWWEVEGLAMLRRYVTSHDDAWRARYVIASLDNPADPADFGASGVPAVELAHRLVLGATSVDLRIDQVWFDRETARYRVVDLKAGATGQSSRLAMGLYAHAWAELASPGRTLTGAIGAAFYDARAGSHDMEVEDVRAEWPLDVVTRLSGAAMAMIEAGLYLPRISGSKGFGTCGSCAHGKICPAVMVTS